MKSTPMARVWSGLLRGAAAGAAGTSALNVISYLDIVVRGRPTSTTPERTVEAMARLFGLTVPGTGDVLANRISGPRRAHRVCSRDWNRHDSRVGLRAGLAAGATRGHFGRHGHRADWDQRTDDRAWGDRPTDLGHCRVDQRSDSAFRIRGGHRSSAALPLSAMSTVRRGATRRG